MASTSEIQEEIEYVEMEPGPVNGAVLYLQGSHRTSNDTWMDRDDPDTVIDHSTSLKKVTSHHPAVLAEIERAGFFHIMQLGYIQMDHCLITALADRWLPETFTFHFPVGEMTVTLGDVAVLLGLPIEGNAVSVGGAFDYMQLCHDLLGLDPPPEKTRGNEFIDVSWFRRELSDDIAADATQVEIQQRARAIILHIIVSRLMCDHTKNRVDLKWLPYLADLGECRNFSWGSAVLAYTYMELSRLSLLENKSIGGCVTLLQLWCWTYLPVGRLQVKRPVVDQSMPLGSRWVGPKKTAQTPRRSVKFFRNELDVLEDDKVTWTPYTQEVLARLPAMCTASRYLWTARVPLICYTQTAYHLPDRVMRQFGMMQHIPDDEPPYTPTYNVEEYALSVHQWNQRHVLTQIEREPTISVEQYKRWYWNITRRYVLTAPVEVVRRNPYTPRAPLERNVADGIRRAAQEVERLRERQTDEESKKMCINIRSILDAVLCRNKLDRPRPPSPPPAAPPAAPSAAPIVYTRRRPRGGEGSSSHATSSQATGSHGAQEFVHGTSQPLSTLPSASTSSSSSSGGSRRHVMRRQRRSLIEFPDLHD